MYKVKHRLCTNGICNIFSDQTSTYNPRQSDFTPRNNTVTYERYSLRFLGPTLWGKFPAADRLAKTLKAFADRMRKSDLTNVMDTG